jgi:hypothetical protein
LPASFRTFGAFVFVQMEPVQEAMEHRRYQDAGGDEDHHSRI